MELAMKREILGTRPPARVALAFALTLSLLFGAQTSSFADKKGSSKLTDNQRIAHILNRIGFGPRPGDIERVKKVGLDKYIEQQLHPERIDDSATEARLGGLDSLKLNIAETYDKYPNTAQLARQLGIAKPGQENQPGQPTDAEAMRAQRENRQRVLSYYSERGLKPPQALLQDLQAQKLIRAVYSERQLQEVMTDFWFNHFNVFWGKGADKWMTTDYEKSAIRPNVLGKFRDLVTATAKSPAMLFYLDNFQSSSPDAKLPNRLGARRGAQNRRPGVLGRRTEPNEMTPEMRQRIANQGQGRKRGINENYARELMELHTLGVDGGYSQKDVQEVARCFTGWSIDRPQQVGKFIFREFMHDDKEKTVLGHRIPAGGGMKDGEMVIDILVHHPNTAKFISTKLVRRFVSDNPPQPLVDKVASVYTKSDGDIREMLKTILSSPEFYSTDAYRAKIKSPFELTVSAIRALSGTTVGSPRTSQFVARMGEPLYQCQPPTGYPDRAEQWVNTGALLERLNFGLALSNNRIPGTTVDLKTAAGDLDSSNQMKVLDRAIEVLLGGGVSTQTRSTLEKQLKEGVPVKGELTNENAMDSGDAMMGRNGLPRRQQRREARLGNEQYNAQAAQIKVDPTVAQIFGLVLGSPEFQRR